MIEADVREAWDVLVRRLGAFIARRVPASDADDVLQEVLLRIHKSAGTVDDDGFGPWVYAVARNAVADHFRRRSTATSASARATNDGADVEAQAAPSGDDDDDPRLLVACVTPFVARLPTPYREALTLVEIEGMTQHEAAKLVGISLSGMKSRVQRGRRLLRAMFDACCALTFDARGRVIDAQAHAETCACSPTTTTIAPRLRDQ